jgi:hypothetical protein
MQVVLAKLVQMKAKAAAAARVALAQMQLIILGLAPMEARVFHLQLQVLV